MSPVGVDPKVKLAEITRQRKDVARRIYANELELETGPDLPADQRNREECAERLEKLKASDSKLAKAQKEVEAELKKAS